MTIKEAAAAWGITERRVNALCKAGRISGAYKEGRRWFIPDSTQKPMDKRGHRSEVKPAVSAARKPLPIGVSDYRDACKNYYYVDKTLMIKEFLDERPKVSLFTRPRRFGKTLNMDMLRTFFEKTTEDTSVYFRDKKIWSCGGSYLAHHRKYPVIFLSFKDVKYTSWEETYQTLQKLIAQEFRRHDELASSSALSDYEKEEYSLLATEAADEVEYQMSLRTLTLLLHKHHNVAPIVIIDEYDTPIQQGHVSGFYDTIIGFMRNLFSGGLKDNPHLSYGFLTGILRVAKESIFSGLNNLKINSILYSRFFKLYIATAIAPIPLASFAGQPSSSIGVAFLKSYAAICLEGCVIVLACVIFSAFASSPPAIADDTLAAATIVWNYVGELIFNMLVLVGAIKMSDRIIRELMGLG